MFRRMMVVLMLLVVPAVGWGQDLERCGPESRLAWEMNAEEEAVQHYLVYYGQAAGVEKEGELIQTFQVPHDTENAVIGEGGVFTVKSSIPLASRGPHYFRVSAVDEHGTESGLSNEVGCILTPAPTTPRIELRFTRGG